MVNTLLLRRGQLPPQAGPPLLDSATDILQQQRLSRRRVLRCSLSPPARRSPLRAHRPRRDGLPGKGGLAEKVAPLQGTQRDDQRPSSPLTTSRTRPSTMKVIRLGTSPDNWIFSSAPYRVRRAWASISCCSAWFNRRVGAMTRMDLRAALASRIRLRPRPDGVRTRRDAYQTQRRNIDLRPRNRRLGSATVSVSCTGARPPARSTAPRRAAIVAARPRPGDNISRTSSGGSCDREHRGHAEGVSAGRTGEVREGCGSQYRVGHDKQPVAGVDMCCAPVHFDHAAFCRRRFYPVAELERLLEQHEAAVDRSPDAAR